MCKIHEELANKFQGIKLFKEQELKGVSWLLSGGPS